MFKLPNWCSMKNILPVMNNRKAKNILVLIIFAELLTLPDEAQALRFVAIGHFRDIITHHTHVIPKLSEAINRENPDFIFFLGDYTIRGQKSSWEVFDSFMGLLKAPIISAPGNHEFYGNIKDYLTRFNYFYKHFETEDANVISINSCDNISTIKKNLWTFWPKLNNGKPTILLSHFKLWTKAQRQSFPPEEILPELGGNVDYIIAGDATKSYKKEVRHGIAMYPVGMSFAGRQKPVVFFLGEITATKKLIMTPKYAELDSDDPWYHEAVKSGFNKNALELDPQRLWEKVKRFTVKGANIKVLIIAAFLMVVIILLLLKRNRKS
jgi:calcineurin-like phosphoesterase family protein